MIGTWLVRVFLHFAEACAWHLAEAGATLIGAITSWLVAGVSRTNAAIAPGSESSKKKSVSATGLIAILAELDWRVEVRVPLRTGERPTT